MDPLNRRTCPLRVSKVSPLSKNLPILDDEQRAAVGLCYKSEGPEAAMKMGYKFVQGALRKSDIKMAGATYF